MQSIDIIRPDDWHIHLRDEEALTTTVSHASEAFGRAIIMPNLTPPVTTVEQAGDYRQRILNHSTRAAFDPLMVLYLTDNTTVDDINEAAQTPWLKAAKLYPAGATTNSDGGVTNIEKIKPVLAAMEKHGLPLLVHGEVTDSDIDIFDREAVFIDRHLKTICQDFPTLKIVLEHITTYQAVDFVNSAPSHVGATITPHHLLFNRNDMLVGGIRPHYYCLPILKRNSHQTSLISAATGGSGKFFLGTDSAPHAQHRKESACGCAGAYTAPHAIAMYAQVFEQAGAIDQLEDFASVFGPTFYGLPINSDTVTLIKKPQPVPSHFNMAGEKLIPLMADQSLQWQVVAS